MYLGTVPYRAALCCAVLGCTVNSSTDLARYSHADPRHVVVSVGTPPGVTALLDNIKGSKQARLVARALLEGAILHSNWQCQHVPGAPGLSALFNWSLALLLASQVAIPAKC